MSKKKATKKYYFSVEGETEQWYLKWLQDTINNTEQAVYRISIDCPVRKDPVKHAKCLNVTQKVEVYHFFDYESDEQTHVNAFMSTMDNMKKAEKIGKQITYKSGYSNFTFDLWIVLHMADSNASYAHRKQYLVPINRAFGEKFASMEEFMQSNQDNGYTLHQYKGYHFYKENPSLESWKAIEKILKDCGLI